MPLRLRGFSAFLRAFAERRISPLLVDEETRAMRRATLHLRSEVLRYIDDERHGVPNRPLTILIKGSSRPLVDRGDLRLGITTDVAGKGRGVVGAVGVLRTARAKRGRRLANVAAALHEGFAIRVTPAVRRAVFAELRRRRGKRVRSDPAAAAGDVVWRVRGRPFIREPLEENEAELAGILGEGVLTWTKRL